MLSLWILLAPGVRAAPAVGAAAAPDPEAFTVLPELEVASSIRRPWRFVAMEGGQVLSLADKASTTAFVQLAAAEIALFHELVPEIPASASYPAFTVVLEGFDFEKMREPTPGLFKQSHFATLDASGDRELLVFVKPKVPGSPTADDAARSSAEEWGSLFAISRRRELLNRHRELPEWYRRGILECGMRLRSSGEGSKPQLLVAYQIKEDTARAMGFARKDAPADGPVLTPWPLSRLLAMSSPDIAVREARDLRGVERSLVDDQCVLLVHWGLRGGGASQREGFRKLVAAAREQAVDDALFRECFGFGLDEGEKRLREFAGREIRAAKRQGRPEPTTSTSGSPRNDLVFMYIDPKECAFLLTDDVIRAARSRVVQRPATRAEVVRIVGEVYLWAALWVEDRVGRERPVSSLNPKDRYRPVLEPSRGWTNDPKTEAKARFLAKTGRMLSEFGEDPKGDDPELAALIGIMDFMAGRMAEAEPQLRAAVATGRARPAACIDLARLWLDRAVREPAGAVGRPAAAQVEPARALLREAAGKCPEMDHVYTLLAYAWGCTGDVPTDDDLALLSRAVRRYPEESAMVCEIAGLLERAGRPAEAAAAATIGLAWLHPNVPERYRVELRRLAALAASAGGADPAR